MRDMLFVCVLGFTTGISMPSLNAYVGFRWKEHRRKLYNVMYVCNNFGLSIGATVGGLIASASFSLTYLLTGSTTLLFTVFLFIFLKENAANPLGDSSKQEVRIKGGKVDAVSLPIELNRYQLIRNVRLYLFISLALCFFGCLSRNGRPVSRRILKNKEWI